MLWTGGNWSCEETEPSSTNPSAEPSCSASGCQSPSHSAASVNASCFPFNMNLLGKPDPGRDARHNRINSVPLRRGMRAVNDFDRKLKFLRGIIESLRLARASDLERLNQER